MEKNGAHLFQKKYERSISAIRPLLVFDPQTKICWNVAHFIIV